MSVRIGDPLRTLVRPELLATTPPEATMTPFRSPSAPPASRPIPPASRPIPPASRPIPPASRPIPPASRPIPPASPTLHAVGGAEAGARSATSRRYLLCRPTEFDVVYTINPWMDVTVSVDRDRALGQWETLRDCYLQLGHEVITVPNAIGLPDMVFAANGGVVVDGIAVGARFANAQRVPEAALYREHLRAAGIDVVHEPEFVNEGEGDLLVAGEVILAGSGFRTDHRAHAEIAALTGRQVVPLRLVDPRYYHLDTAACVLDDDTIAYLPEAFDAASRDELERRFPHAVLVSPHDAEVLGLNAVSDGRHVVINREAQDFRDQLEDRGFVPVPVDLSEFRKAGGGPKCCTLELRAAPETANLDLEEVVA
jgi:N-dimethylarginine dimethylaminohydrolase